VGMSNSPCLVPAVVGVFDVRTKRERDLFIPQKRQLRSPGMAVYFWAQSVQTDDIGTPISS
jgi:hypothetical protein